MARKKKMPTPPTCPQCELHRCTALLTLSLGLPRKRVTQQLRCGLVAGHIGQHRGSTRVLDALW